MSFSLIEVCVSMYDRLKFMFVGLCTRQTPLQWIPGLRSRGKAAGRGVDRPPTSGVEVKERVELQLWAFMACSLVTFM
jgi:hypothetical protein